MADDYLEIQTPKGTQKVPLDGDSLTIGRHPTNLLPLEDSEASRFHCVIEKTREGWQVKDLDSRNGTRLNGAPVKVSPLTAGDVVTIGQTALRLLGSDMESDRESGNGRKPAMLGAPPPGAATGPTRPMMDQVDLEQDETGADPEGSLRRIADNLPDQTVQEGDIALLNARGETVHAATGRQKRSRNPEGKETVN